MFTVMKWGRYIMSSFGEIRCCDQKSTVTVPTDPETPVYAWRVHTASITCVVDGNGKQTGYAHVNDLEKYDVSTGVATGDLKSNLPSEPEYQADYIDTNACPIPQPITFTGHNGTPNSHTVIHMVSIDGTKTHDIDLYPGQTKVVSIEDTYWNIDVYNAPAGSGGATQFRVTVNGNTIPLNFGEHHTFETSGTVTLDVVPN